MPDRNEDHRRARRMYRESWENLPKKGKVELHYKAIVSGKMAHNPYCFVNEFDAWLEFCNLKWIVWVQTKRSLAKQGITLRMTSGKRLSAVLPELKSEIGN